MRIGIDFDGVISDCTVVKQVLAKEWYKTELKPEECTTEIAKKIIGKEEYEKIYKTIESGKLALSCNPTKNCGRTLAQLIADGHKIVIVTTLDVQNVRYATEFMNQNNIPYNHWVSVPWRRDDSGIIKKVKKQFIVKKLKLNVLIDDSYENLTPLVGSGVLLLLFETFANKQKPAQDGIIRVKGWQEAYDLIKNYQK